MGCKISDSTSESTSVDEREEEEQEFLKVGFWCPGSDMLRYKHSP